MCSKWDRPGGLLYKLLVKRVAESLHTDATAAITQQQVEGADLQDEAFSGRCVRAAWHK